MSLHSLLKVLSTSFNVTLVLPEGKAYVRYVKGRQVFVNAWDKQRVLNGSEYQVERVFPDREDPLNLYVEISYKPA